MAEEQLLANQEDYRDAGVHFATKVKSPGMKKFIYRVRNDGLYLLGIKTIDSRIAVAAKFIARYAPGDVVATASRIYAITPAQKFAELIGAKFVKGRVVPGVFTNPNRSDFIEPKLLLISDSRNEKQAVKEATKVNIPIIALCDTDNSTKFIDLVIPANNHGRRSLAFVYYLLAREVLKARGAISSNEEFKYSIDDFETKVDARQMAPQEPQ
jgi:small subunit ribosomal protein S2